MTSAKERPAALDAPRRAALLEALSGKLRERYIDPEVAAAMAAAIRQRAAGGCPLLFSTHFFAAFRPRLDSEVIDSQ